MDKIPKLRNSVLRWKVKKPFYGLLEKNFAQYKSFTQVKRKILSLTQALNMHAYVCRYVYVYVYIWLALPYVRKI